MSRHARPYGSRAGGKGGFGHAHKLFPYRAVSRFDSDTRILDRNKEKPKPPFTSAACKKGNHNLCSSTKCECQCRHY